MITFQNIDNNNILDNRGAFSLPVSRRLDQMSEWGFMLVVPQALNLPRP